MANNLLSTVELINKANEVLTKHLSLLTANAKEVERLNEQYKKLPSNYITELKTIDSYQKKITQSTKELNAAEKANNAQIKSKIPTLRQIGTLKRQEEAANKKLTSAWYKLNQQLKTAEERYKDLAASQGLSNKQTITAQKEVQKLRSRVDSINAPIKRFGDNVGNYKSALSGAVPLLRSFVSAFGLTSGVYLFVGAIKDAFNRVREFDKAMQNIAGIMRVTRDEIKDLETEIIKVASTSIKTAREVAELAENLVTLGKTKSEIKDLLEPVNNLAIGLETTSGEAAEFLVQTLNAFGAGSDEAEKYADTIATIRTSTTLDFQKMRDSFQYLTPISRILNKDLAYTGSVIGILADNGLKAEQAGRLLGTAQQKLAKEGKTLVDALNEINQAYKDGKTEIEILGIASDLFGAQAAKVGAILASNTDLIEKNAQAIRENGGALDDLVNEQLKSLDAQLKILDSTWEEFILSIERGDSILSDVFKTFVKLTTAVIKFNTILLSSQTKEQRITEETYNSTLKLLNQRKESIDVIKSSIDIEKRRLAQLKTAEKFNNLTKKQLEENNIEQLKSIGVLKALREYESQYTDSLKENTDELKENTEEESKRQKVLEGTITYYKNLISKLESERDATARSKEEWDAYEKKIRDVKHSLHELLVEINGISHLKSLGDFESSWKRIQDILTEPMIIEGLDYDKPLQALKDWSKEYEKQQKKVAELHKYYANQREDYEKQLSENLKDLAYNTVNSIFDRQMKSVEKEEEMANKRYDLAISNAGGIASAEEEIERQHLAEQDRLAEERAKIEQRAFLFQQGFKLGEIAIDTVQKVAAIKTQAALLASNPVTAALASVALAQIPLVISTGAVAAGAVLAQSIPAFAEGGEHDGGLMLVNDAKRSNYREVIERPDGTTYSPKGRNQILNEPSGTIIHPTYDAFINSLDNELLSNNIMPVGTSSIAPMIINKGLTKGEVMEVMNEQTSRVVNTISKQHGIKINIDENGINKYIKKKSGTSKIMNARYSGKGISV